MEPTTLHVPSPSHPTLASALAACASSPNATIVLAAGVYHADATLRLGHGASLVGAGPSTVVESVAHTTLVCDGAARVADLALRQLGDGDARPAAALEVRAGALVVERYAGRAQPGEAAAAVSRWWRRRAAPHGCTVAESGHAGVVLAGGARATLEQNEVGGCAACGVLARAGCELVMDGCVVRGCGDSGVLVSGRARASLTACELRANGGASGGAALSARAHATVRLSGCTVADAPGVGVQLDEGSDARIERSSLLRCGRAAVAARGACSSSV